VLRQLAVYSHEFEARIAKNFDADSISVSLWWGEAEIRNLQLDEQVLTDLLGLPKWLRLTQATVNRVSIRTKWFSLKSVALDEVVVVLETCNPKPPFPPGATVSSHASEGLYDFVDKLVNGFTLTVRSIKVIFRGQNVFNTNLKMLEAALSYRGPPRIPAPRTPLRLMIKAVLFRICCLLFSVCFMFVFRCLSVVFCLYVVCCLLMKSSTDLPKFGLYLS